MEVHQVQLQFTGQSASIPSLSASFAGSKLGGKLQINNFEAPTLQFALNADRLDLSKLEQMINTSEGAAPAKPVSLHQQRRHRTAALPRRKRLLRNRNLFQRRRIPWDD